MPVFCLVCTTHAGCLCSGLTSIRHVAIVLIQGQGYTEARPEVLGCFKVDTAAKAFDL